MGLLYSRTKIFHYPDKLASLPRDVPIIEPPLHIRLKPTNRCNHNCRYCAYRTDELQLGKDMNRHDSIPEDKFLEIIRDIVDMGVKAVTFSGGGEPLIYAPFVKGLKELARGGVKSAALTNGACLTGEVAEIFASNGTWVRISIDGWDDDSYAQYRSVPTTEFSRVLNNMEAFAALDGNCYLGVSLIVDEKNAGHVHELVGRLKDTGARSVKISPCIVSNSGAANNRYHEKIYGLVTEQAQRSIEDYQEKTFEISNSYHLLDEKFNKDYHWCPIIQIQPVIAADSNVYSCHDKAYNLEKGLLGCLIDTSFKDFWFSDKANFFTIDPSVDCRHHCCANGTNQLALDFLESEPGHRAFV